MDALKEKINQPEIPSYLKWRWIGVTAFYCYLSIPILLVTFGGTQAVHEVMDNKGFSITWLLLLLGAGILSRTNAKK